LPTMARSHSNEDVIARAATGDEDALVELLLAHHDRLAQHISEKLPVAMQAVIDAGDVLQQTYIDAFVAIGRLELRSEKAFFRWLTTIADHRLIDAVKSLKRKKRGGDHQRAYSGPSSSMADLLELLSDSITSPSGQAARNEGIQVLESALGSLPDDYRQAVRLRYLEGKGIEEIAPEMDRTPDAVRGLLYRALKKLRDAMGQSSLYLSRP